MGNSDTYGARDARSVNPVLAAQRRNQAGRNLFSILRPGQVLKQYDKLIAAKTCNCRLIVVVLLQVTGQGHAAKAHSDLSEHVVTCIMAVGVVQSLEVIEVQEEHREVPFRCHFESGDRRIDPGRQAVTIQHTSEPIMCDLVLEPGQQRLCLKYCRYTSTQFCGSKRLAQKVYGPRVKG